MRCRASVGFTGEHYKVAKRTKVDLLLAPGVLVRLRRGGFGIFETEKPLEEVQSILVDMQSQREDLGLQNRTRNA